MFVNKYEPVQLVTSRLFRLYLLLQLFLYALPKWKTLCSEVNLLVYSTAAD